MDKIKTREIPIAIFLALRERAKTLECLEVRDGKEEVEAYNDDDDDDDDPQTCGNCQQPLDGYWKEVWEDADGGGRVQKFYCRECMHSLEGTVCPD